MPGVVHPRGASGNAQLWSLCGKRHTRPPREDRPPTKEGHRVPFWGVTEWRGTSRPEPLLKQFNGEGPHRPDPQGDFKNERHQRKVIERSLETIEPNPGPKRRGMKVKRNPQQRRRRIEEKMRRRRRGRRGDDGGGRREVTVVTWNMQKTAINENNRRRLRIMVRYMESKKWKIVLATEITAKEKGVVWLGEGEHQAVVIHSERAAIILRKEALEEWMSGNQRKWFSRRTVAVKINNIKLVAAYQPTTRANREEIEEYRFEMENHLSTSNREEILIVGGDHNSHIGANTNRPGTSGRYGMRTSNAAGEELLNWCEENCLAYANSFSDHRNRGPWYHQGMGRWYELDGFILKKEQRHRIMKKMWTGAETALSDHRPKIMKIKTGGRKWRRSHQERRKPQIDHEALRDEKKIEYRRKTAEKCRQRQEEWREDSTNWEEISEILTSSAREVCGNRPKKIENPWMQGRGEEMRILNEEISMKLETLRELQRRSRTRLGRERNEEELRRIKADLKAVRMEKRRRLREWENQWWQNIIDECREEYQRGNIGNMYKKLRLLGKRGRYETKSGTTITKEQFKSHFEETSGTRYELTPQEIENAVSEMEDLRTSVRAREANERINDDPSEEEIDKATKETKNSAPGKDGVRINYIWNACGEIKEQIRKMIVFMFRNRANKWDNTIKKGHMVPIFKKGDKNSPGNYRGVVLLAMGSRILARLMANRLRWWSEHMELLDENQNGFREGRSTADTTQIITRIQEDVSDLRKRRAMMGVPLTSPTDPEARLLDLRKAYPRVNKPAMWKILERCGMRGNFLATLIDLHESTEYCIKSQEGDSEPWTPERGLREGCPTSPSLFNIYHQVTMRRAEEARRERAGSELRETGVPWRWVPGNCFPSTGLWEKHNSEAVKHNFTSALFADDTTVLGERVNMETEVEITKEQMGKYEEKTNDAKEEALKFGEEGSGDVRMLGSWVGPKEDVRNRIRRANGAWRKLKEQLKHTKLSKRMQAKVVEACLESSLLFDCHTRVWYLSEIKALQRWIDRAYRYIWSNKTCPPLRQMQRERRNMQDVRNTLNIPSLRIKIEKRTMERIGHIMRMENNREVKIATLGWYEKLEQLPKTPGKKRKTTLYWRKILREAGVDLMEIEQLTSDRDEWKKRVMERAEHLTRYEKQKGHHYREDQGERRIEDRNHPVTRDNSLRCTEEGCNKVCKSRGGLAIHRKRMHKINENISFECPKCTLRFGTENTMKNHFKTCGGIRSENRRVRTCEKCGKTISKSNIARHRTACRGAGGAAGGAEQQELRARVYRARQGECEDCGRVLSATNMARHRRACGGRGRRGGANL